MYEIKPETETPTFQMIDDSMAPKIAKGAAVKTRRGPLPKAGDCIVVRAKGALLFREVLHLNGRIILSPVNAAYRVYRFSHEEWKSVDILGVVSAVETPRGT